MRCRHSAVTGKTYLEYVLIILQRLVLPITLTGPADINAEESGEAEQVAAHSQLSRKTSCDRQWLHFVDGVLIMLGI